MEMMAECSPRRSMVLCDVIEQALDEAERRGELNGRVKECDTIRTMLLMITTMEGCPRIVVNLFDTLKGRLAQLRAGQEGKSQ